MSEEKRLELIEAYYELGNEIIKVSAIGKDGAYAEHTLWIAIEELKAISRD